MKEAKKEQRTKGKNGGTWTEEQMDRWKDGRKDGGREGRKEAD